MKQGLVIVIAGLLLSGCAASTSDQLATTGLGQRYVATSLSAEKTVPDAPYTAILHIPIGVTQSAEARYAETFGTWLRDSDEGVVSSDDTALDQAHRAFIKSNGLTAPLRSGLDLGIMMAADPQFIVAHYVIAEHGGRLTRDYLDDPADYPPSLVHADLQLLSEPRDPLLYTGDGDVLTLGSVGAPVVALAYSPDLSDVFVTSDKLEGTNFLDMLSGKQGSAPAELPTEIASFDVSAAADTRAFVRGVIFDGINGHADPARMLDDDQDWFDFYSLVPRRDDATVREVAEIEVEVIEARNQALRRLIEAQAGDALRNLKTAEAATYDKRREIAVAQTRAEIQMGLSVLSAVLGTASGAMAASTGDTVASQQAEGILNSASDGMEAAQIELETLSAAAVDVADAFGGFFSTTIKRDLGGVIETGFGDIDASEGLAAAKPIFRDALGAEG